MTKNINDTKTLERLTSIIFKLIRGEKLTTRSLAEEFGYTRRTIQRDFSERLPKEIYQHLIVEKGNYYLEPRYICSTFPAHMQKILALVNAEDILPHQFTPKSLQKLLSYHKDTAPFSVRSARRAILTAKDKQIHAQLEKAITTHLTVQFNYRKNQTEKTYQEIQPYKLIDHQGIWYLAAVDSGKLKTFSLSNIVTVYIGKTQFEQDKAIQILIDKDESIWLSENKFAVELGINTDYAEYFTRRNVIPNQTTELNPDKTVTVRAEVTDENEILPIIRYWLPAIESIKPESLKRTLLEQLENRKKYLLSPE